MSHTDVILPITVILFLDRKWITVIFALNLTHDNNMSLRRLADGTDFILAYPLIYAACVMMT